MWNASASWRKNAALVSNEKAFAASVAGIYTNRIRFDLVDGLMHVTDELEQIRELIKALHSHDLTDRVAAAQILGEIGDEEALKALRQRLNAVNQELVALVTAIADLKNKLGVK